MRINTARTLIEVAIVLLIVSEVGSWLGRLLGTIPALIGALVVAALQLLCGRLARANVRYHLFLWIPTLLFTILPAALKLRALLTREGPSTLARLWAIAPTLVGFVLPVFLLMGAWWCLRGRDGTSSGHRRAG